MIRIKPALGACHLLALMLSMGAPPALAATEPIARYALVRYYEGSELASLPVGKTTYREVKVRSVTVRTVMITHTQGMAAVRLRDLSPELQAAFGYDPAADQTSDAALSQATALRQAQLAAAARAADKPVAVSGKFDQLLREFGRTAPMKNRVDLRPKFRALELHAKDQGRRPSCSVFAVVSALEYLQAEATGQAEKLSEEYLIWATLMTIQRSGAGAAQLMGDDADAGFALTEVVTALRSYGIPPYEVMPNTLGRNNNFIAEPPPAVIAAARQRTRVAVHLVPGRDNATQLNNVVHALNAEIPVAIGTAWPRFRNMRAALLNSQEPIPGYGHAVTLVGYTTETGRMEDAVFIFKNSWGANWGANGFGFATYAYLLKHLQNAILLELNLGG